MLLVCPLGPAPLFFLTTKGEKVIAASDATTEFGKGFLLGTLVIFVFLNFMILPFHNHVELVYPLDRHFLNLVFLNHL